MKSQERHKLKENEFAEWVVGLPTYLRENSSRIIGVVMIILAVLVGGRWMLGARATARNEQASQLQSLMVDSDMMQRAAVEDARMGDASIGGQLYDTGKLVGSLRELSQAGGDSPVGMMAMLQQAEVMRTELLFSSSPMGPTDKEQLCQEAEKLYERIKLQYPGNATAVGMASFGLGLLAEERGEQDKAKAIYEGIISKEEGLLAGTVYPMQAQKRLKVLDEVVCSIEFPAAPIEEIPELEFGGGSEDEPGAGVGTELEAAPPTEATETEVIESPKVE
ncbi:MAG: hypothetical protein E4H40_07870 [Candidatus Brocadiia bacterium]|nr:MAG: hypothetical protein E4H40_07870 [Candidatus Brocadiia bacterium]